MERRDHWEAVYAAKGDVELSWFQAQPEMSLRIIRELKPKRSSALDVGGGQSMLAGELVAMGVPEVTVLDLSAAALERAKQRLGPLAEKVRWITGDILGEVELGSVNLWHDRAVLHFFTDPVQRARYFARLRETLRPGGVAIIAGFAPDGPPRCSGLDVVRTDAARLSTEIGPGFRLLREDAETHSTPWGGQQRFMYATFTAEPPANTT